MKTPDLADEQQTATTFSQSGKACAGWNFTSTPVSEVRSLQWLQPKLEIGSLDDPLEREAEATAARVMRMTDANGDKASSPGSGKAQPKCSCGSSSSNGECEECKKRNQGTLQRLPAQAPPPAGIAPRIVDDVLHSPGQPLNAATRAFFEPRFGHDFSNVRIHAGIQAAHSAERVGALAYTVGSNVVFGEGRYSPASWDGRCLLAHELAHVVQQGLQPQRIQRQPQPQKKAGAQFKFSVQLSGILGSDELLIEFVKQYHNLATNAQAVELRDRQNWRWAGTPPTVTESDVARGYVLISVDDPTITPATDAEKKSEGKFFKSLSQAEQGAINAEVDREFWQKTHYRVGKKLGAFGDDKQMAEYWKILRHDLIQKRQAVDALPPNIQNFIFDDQAPNTLDPQDFQTVLRIASKVAGLTPAELAEYKDRVTAKTSDWTIYEAAIDRFIAERKEREATVEEREKIETRFYNLDALYDRYRSYLSLLTGNARLAGMGAAGSPQAAGASLGSQPTINKVRAELDADLVKAGFPGGISDFEKLIKGYENAFERETLAIATVMLDQYAHLLWTQEQRYRNLDEADQLFQSLSKTSARAEYEEADKIRSEHAQTIVLSQDEMAEQAYWVGQRNQALGRARSQVLGAASTHPLVSEPDFDRERLARASSKTEVQSVMLNYIAARKKDIGETRKNLSDKPNMIYGLDSLLEASYQAQHVQSGSIQDKIIKNHISDVHWTEAIPQIILAVIAIAAGLLSGGGGTVAVLAAGTSLGIGAYQALEEFRRYERQSAAHGAKLTSDDPTIAWVIVAVVGAGIDAAAFAAALPKLRPAIEAFNAGAEADDVAKLAAKLDKLTDVEEGIRTNIIRGAAAEKEARAAWKATFRLPPLLRTVIIPGAERFGRLVYAVYLSIKRGIREFQVFLKTNEAIDLIGDVAKLSAEDLAALKTGYLKAIEEMESVAAHGTNLGMSESEIRAFMNLRGETKGMTAEQVVQEMDRWAATKASGVPFGFQSAEQFEKFQSVAASELKKLLGKADSQAEAFLQGSAVGGVSYTRHLPFDAASDFDVAISSRYLMKQAEKLGYEVKLSPRRIGPLDQDQIAKLGLSRFQNRLGAAAEEAAAAGGTTGAAASRKVNIMLFDTAEAVKKPLGAASTETERAARLLKVGK